MNLYLAALLLASLPASVLAQNQPAPTAPASQEATVALRTEANLVLVPTWVGTHEEPIRQYLAGEASLPGNVFVVLTVCTDNAAQLIVNAPWLVPTEADAYLQIEMFVRGLWFVVLAGDAEPQGMRSLSMLGSAMGSIYVRNCTDQVVLRNRHFLESAANDLKPLS